MITITAADGHSLYCHMSWNPTHSEYRLLQTGTYSTKILYNGMGDGGTFRYCIMNGESVVATIIEFASSDKGVVDKILHQYELGEHSLDEALSILLL